MSDLTIGEKAAFAWVVFCVTGVFILLASMVIHDTGGMELKELLGLIVNVLVAAGTFGAAYAAVWVAGKQARDAQQKARDRATLVTYGIASGVEDFYIDLQIMTRSLIACDTVDSSIPDVVALARHRELRDRIHRLVSHAALDVDVSTLEALLAIDRDAAKQIYAICIKAKVIRNRLTLDYRKEFMSVDPLRSAAELTELYGSLMTICMEVRQALDVLNMHT